MTRILKVRIQEIPGVTGKFGLGVQKEVGQRLTEFCQENALVIANIFFQQIRDDSTQRYHQISSVQLLSSVRLFATPWTIAYQTPLSMGFSRQQYWSGLPFPSAGDLPDQIGRAHV